MASPDDERHYASEVYDDTNFGFCDGCQEDHVLCPTCGMCLKYCHDLDYCYSPGDPYGNPRPNGDVNDDTD